MGNIANLINNIKTAIFGKDVRQSICDAIEQCYEDASKNGNANMEVVQARDTYETLSKRLEIERNALQSQISGLSKGSPKGVYENLETLLSENPETGVYIISGNGHIYSWNKDDNSAIDLGIYQSTGIADKSVEFIKLEDDLQDFIKHTEDLTENRINKGGRINYTTGGFESGIPNRARTGRMYGANHNIKYVYCKSDVYDISAFGYDSFEGEAADHFIKGSASGWLNGTIYKISSPYIGLNIRRYDDEEITDSDIDTVKTKVIKVIYDLDTTLNESGKIPDSKAVGERLANINNYLPYSNEMLHFTVTVNSVVPANDSADSSTDEEVKCVLMLPTSYNEKGQKTPLIAMCHGASGTVTDNVWYNNNWMILVNAYLDAGYAVFGFNRKNESASGFGKTYGSPVAIEVMKKAFDYIKKNYNIEDRLFVHGTSMGGTTAQQFAFTYPDLVKAVSCFAPANTLYSIWRSGTQIRQSPDCDYIAQCFGYETRAAAKEDEYKNLVGNMTGLRIKRFNKQTNMLIPSDIVNIEDSIEANANGGFWHSDNEYWLLDFPVPIKIWMGTADTSVEQSFNECVVKAIRNAGGIGYLKLVNGGTHTDVSYGLIDNMQSEAIMWFNRFN